MSDHPNQRSATYQSAATNFNSSGASLNFSISTEAEDNEKQPTLQSTFTEVTTERSCISRTSSQSLSCVDSETGESSSESRISGITTDDAGFLDGDPIRECDTCKLLQENCPSKETIDFWDGVKKCGSDDRIKCHSKFWTYFSDTMRKTFPEEEGLKNKQVLSLLRKLLCVEKPDDAEILLSNLVKIVRFFGPIKKDKENKCILIRHLTKLVKDSQIKVKDGDKTVKNSWFAGDMSREDADERLQNQKDNTYLVRMSQSGSEEGNFVVSVKDQHGIHHFEIEGNPEASSESPYLNCHLSFRKEYHKSLPDVIGTLIHNAIEYEGGEVNCTFICKNLPFNCAIVPYKEQKRTKTTVNLKKNVSSEKERKEKEFQVITDINFLPRYTCHRSLLDWFMEDIPQDPMFQACHFNDCTILIGGNVTDETISKICGETTLREKLGVRDLRKEAVKHTHSLIVYFLRSNVTNEYREIEQIVKQLSFEGTFLFVMTSEMFDNEQIKSTLKENVLELGNLNVEIDIENRSDILLRMTRVLEQRLVVYLEQTKMKLRDYSRYHNVRSSLREVNAILRRLKQAACYPEPYTDEEEEEHLQENEMDKILHSFGDKIIYQRYDGETMYVITTDQDVKVRLDTWYSTSSIKDIKFVITVDDKLPISELATPIESLHGAKMVYVNENVDAFERDLDFATTGSLMMANGDSMVIITCKHALKEKKHVYTLIDKAVVRLGQGIEQPLDEMQRLNEDIAVVEIDEETRSVITDKCEKMLLGGNQRPSPAKISLRKLKKDDIVYKRGANTKLTIGIVESVEDRGVHGFGESSCVIFIRGFKNRPFADKGDSGSLVFQPSMSVEDPYLDVFAMVQSKVDIPSPTCNPDIVCFPFHEGCDVLIRNIQHLNYLQFYNV